MVSTRFQKAVVIQPGRIDRDRVVTSATDAARVLLEDWPQADGEKRSEAMQACLDAINGTRPAREARKAFVAAAKDARIYIGDFN